MPSTNISITATDNTKKAFNSVDNSLNGMKKGVGALKTAFTALAGAMVLRQFASFALNTMKNADTIGKFADKLGFTTTQLQTFRFAGEQAGETWQTMDNNLVKFTKQLGEAQIGIGMAKTEFKALNIDLQKANGEWKTNAEMLDEVADAWMGIDDPARKMSSAMALFGRSGHVMVNMLSNGKEGLADLRQSLIETGGIIREDFIRDSEEANDAMNRLSKTFGVLTTKILSGVAPAILRVTEGIQRLMGFNPVKTMSLDRLNEQLNKTNELLDYEKKRLEELTEKGGMFSSVMIKGVKNHIAQNEELKKQILEQIQKKEELVKKNEEIKKIALKNLHVEKKITKENTVQKKVKEKNEEQEKARLKAVKDQEIAEKARSKRIKEWKEELRGAYQDLIDFKRQQAEDHGQRVEAIGQLIEIHKRGQDEEMFMLDEKFKKRKELIDIASTSEHISVQQKNQLILKAEEDHNKKVIQLHLTRTNQLAQMAKGLANELYSAGLISFDAMRATAYAEAMINAHLSATKALSSLPPPYSYGVAGMSYAMAIARAYKIAHMKPPAREYGGTVQKNKSYVVGERGAEVFVPNQTGSIVPNSGNSANITFNIQANDASGFDELLIARRGMIVSMINQAMNDSARSGLI